MKQRVCKTVQYACAGDEFELDMETPEDSGGDIFNLLNRNRDHQIDDRFLQWKYNERQKAHGPPQTIYCRYHGSVVGGLTCFPTLVSGLSDDGNAAFQVGDISVDEKFRGKGIALAMVRSLEMYCGKRPFLICIPNEGARAVLKKAGWKRICQLLCFTHVLRVSIKGRNSLINMLKKAVNLALIGIERLTLGNGSGRYTFEPINEDVQDLDTLWEKSVQAKKFEICRNRACFRWRYLLNPNRNYRCVSIKHNGAIQGYIVLLSKEKKTISILDYQYIDRVVFRTMTAWVTRTARREGYDRVEIFLNRENRAEIRSLLSLGYIKRKGVWNIFGKGNEDVPEHKAAMDGKNWFFTAADKEI